MRREIKLAFEQIEKELNALSKAEQLNILGGNYGGGYGPNGYCLFNTMSYLIGEFTGTSPSYISLFDQYTNQYGFGQVVYNDQKQVDAVDSGSASDFRQFFQNHFNMSRTSINTTQQMLDTLNSGNVMVAAFQQTEQIINSSGFAMDVTVYHNVVIKGINPETGFLIYFDPTTGNTIETNDAGKFSSVFAVYSMNPLNTNYTQIYTQIPGYTGDTGSYTTLDPYATTSDPQTTDNFGNPITTTFP